MAGLDAIDAKNRFDRTFYPAKVPRVILSIIELEHTGVVAFAVKTTDESFDS